MSAGKTLGAFVVGAAAGAAIALLFAPKSGEELRRYLTNKGENGLKQVRRKMRRSIEQVEDLMEKGNDRVSAAVNTSKHALDALADHID